jgi:hypothetical protein
MSLGEFPNRQATGVEWDGQWNFIRKLYYPIASGQHDTNRGKCFQNMNLNYCPLGFAVNSR